MGALNGNRRVLLFVNLAAGARMVQQDLEMRRTGGPGIVGFELVGSVARAEAILDAWGPKGQDAARHSLLADYPYLATYAPLLAALYRGAGRRFEDAGHRRLARLGPAVAATQYLAAACDAGENTALLAILGGRRGRVPQLATTMSLTKFCLLGAGIAYGAAALMATPR